MESQCGTLKHVRIRFGSSLPRSDFELESTIADDPPRIRFEGLSPKARDETFGNLRLDFIPGSKARLGAQPKIDGFEPVLSES